MRDMKTIKVTQKPEAEVPTEVLAEAITKMADGIRKLRNGRLNDYALHILIQHAAPGNLTRNTIRNVLEGIDSLERTYLRKKP
jgi:hypothetical protein